MTDQEWDLLNDLHLWFVAYCGVKARQSGQHHTLPLHRTQANVGVSCSTCDGGGCLDCTDPA